MAWILIGAIFLTVAALFACLILSIKSKKARAAATVIAGIVLSFVIFFGLIAWQYIEIPVGLWTDKKALKSFMIDLESPEQLRIWFQPDEEEDEDAYYSREYMSREFIFEDNNQPEKPVPQ